MGFCLGFLWVAWGKDKRGWHDKLAGTIVVYPQRLETAEPISTETDDRSGGSSIRVIGIAVVVIIALLGGLRWHDPLLVSERVPVTTESNYMGAIYSSRVSARLPNSYGTHTFSKGDKYVGEWKNGKRHGHGTYTWADGLKYV